ncbi:MAG: AMP-dependent synthetase [Burkholderiaceae bacterium]|nr:MAG: AMP-dependent synthetase [Burkholderiaceae bacterium]
MSAVAPAPAIPASDQRPLHEALRQQARAQPDRTAVVWYGARITWVELDRASDAFGARLQALGVKKGDPVVLFMGNCPQYLMAHYGIQKIGAIVCPASSLFKEHELGYQVKDLKARVIVAAAELLPVVDQVRAGSSLEHVFVVHDADWLPPEPTIDLPAELVAARGRTRDVPQGCEDFLAVTRSGAQPKPVEVALDDVALMTYTSGTTGLPKGAMLTYGNALYKSECTALASDLKRDSVALSIAPLYHIAGMLMGVDTPILKGATQVLLYRFDPKAVLQAIDRYKVTYWYSIAPMNVACMQVPGAERYDLSSLQRNPVTSFGIAFTEPLAQQWQAFTKGPCISCEAAYGLSETHTMDTGMPFDAIRWGTHGKPMPGNTLRIIDPDTGAERPTGEMGEIIVKGKGNFKGYWNKPEATAKTLVDGWVHTGDMGKMDADGYLTFIGRFKEMIKVSGYSVFPEEVETILIKHPAVAQAAVIPEADPQKGEVVKAFIVKKPGADLSAEDLIAWAREHMAVYKAPKHVRFIDALPATGSGKVLRRLLKDRG